jgi:hypothetical protein
MSGTTSKPSKAATLARVQALISGLQKRFPSGQFTLGNVAYTTASLVQLFESLVKAIEAVDAAHASVKDAVAALREAQAKVGPIEGAFKRFVLAMYGNATQILADFGLEPPKAPAPRTSEEKAAATAKLRATRAARGTTSKKQKLAVKGNVTGVEITPITAPSAHPTATAPAQPPPSPPAVTTAGAPSAPVAAPPATPAK